MGISVSLFFSYIKVFVSLSLSCDEVSVSLKQCISYVIRAKIKAKGLQVIFGFDKVL